MPLQSKNSNRFVSSLAPSAAPCEVALRFFGTSPRRGAGIRPGKSCIKKAKKQFDTYLLNQQL